MAEFFNVSTDKTTIDKDGIDMARVLIVVFSKEWQGSVIRQQELSYAVQSKKLIAVAIFDDVPYEKYLTGANVVVLRFFDRAKMSANRQLAKELVEDFLFEVQEKTGGVVY